MGKVFQNTEKCIVPTTKFYETVIVYQNTVGKNIVPGAGYDAIVNNGLFISMEFHE